jgi:uncharacterized LabA/DUF88 family protein
MDRTAVFIDYQNVHLGAHDLFGARGKPVYESLIDPVALAERIAQKRSRHFSSEVTDVRVFRGRPNPERQRTLAAANEAQTSAWQKDRRVQVIRRDLNYRGWPEQPPQEKGVDVALAIDLVHTALQEQYDVAVVMTSDTDILPAVELVYSETKPRVEIAAWQGAKPLWFPAALNEGRYLPFCHFLSRSDFELVRDHRSYV